MDTVYRFLLILVSSSSLVPGVLICLQSTTITDSAELTIKRETHRTIRKERSRMRRNANQVGGFNTRAPET